MLPKPKPTSTPPRKLPNGRDLASDHFGPTEGLAVIERTTRELAAFYVREVGLGEDDFQRNPELTIVAMALATVRHRELILLQRIEQDMHDRVLESGGRNDYADVLFETARRGSHTAQNTELDRLHRRGNSYRQELEKLAQRILGDPQESSS